MIIYTYEISETLNSKVNFQKLFLEINASTVPCTEVSGVSGKIYISVTQELTEPQKLELLTLINSHDGQDASAFSQTAIESRELLIRELNQTAIFHPNLDNNTTVSYLTSIDNYVNGWIRSGINTVIIQKIISDAQLGEPYFDFLHTIVNERGNKTYEYFISKLQ